MSNSMTNEEAIAKLEVYSSTNGSGQCTFDEHQEAKELAIKALEKQIPKKPDYEGDGYDENGNIIYDTWICPNCNHNYEADYDDYDFCPNCGQALDWSDEE